MSSDSRSLHGLSVGNLQLVDRFVEAGVGVDVRAEPHAERLHEVANGIAGKVLRAVEGHVLDEVGQAALVFVLEHGPGIDREPKLGAGLRQPVLADVVAEAIGQCADRDQRIHRHDLVERGGADRFGDRRRCHLLRAGQAQRGDDGGDEKHKPDASVINHELIRTQIVTSQSSDCSQNPSRVYLQEKLLASSVLPRPR